MTEILTLENGNQVEAGCWLEGAHGWTNSYRIVDVATHHGMELDTEDAAIVEWYRASGDSDAGSSDAELDRLEAMTGQGGITDRAIDYMGEQLPEGWVLTTDMGEYTVMRDWQDCANEGNGCEIQLKNDGQGRMTEVVKLCFNHNPCEGHVDDDVTLLSGVSIGESRYCDGSCV